MLMNEFHTLNGICSNLVPQGPSYENVTLANQVCTTVGSLPGQVFVNGNRFGELSYGFSYSNTWRVRPFSHFVDCNLTCDIEFWFDCRFHLCVYHSTLAHHPIQHFDGRA